jgi:hypothetical protein
MKGIRITDAKTGQIRYSDPEQQREPRFQTATPSNPQGSDTHTTEANLATSLPDSTGAAPENVDASKADDVSKRPQPKPKVEITTLEQFIAHAYGLKGRNLYLKPKVERQIAQSTHLSDEARLRLVELSRKDTLFVVPRQLLLAARQVTGYPGLRGAIREFVRDRMLNHSLFRQERIEDAVRNLDSAPTSSDVMKQLALSDKKVLPADIAASIKDAEFEQLRNNALYCMAVWLADMKGLSITSVIDMLLTSMWAPRAARFETDFSKLGAVTSIGELGGVGLACEEYRRQAKEKTQTCESATREAEVLQTRTETLEAELADQKAVASEAEAKWESEKQALVEQIESMRIAHGTETAHLRDDLERQRTRVLRRLKSDLHLLEEGLQALGRPEPKVHVMVDHAERIGDALRQEIKNLQEGE